MKLNPFIVTFIYLLLINLVGYSQIKISGNLPSYKNEKAILSEWVSLDGKKLKPIDTLTIEGNGRFTKSLHLNPNMYQFSIGRLKLSLAIDANDQIEFYEKNDEIQMKGSFASDEYTEYEEFRKSILNSIVYPIRKQLSNAQKTNENESLIKDLGIKQTLAEQLYRDTLASFVKKMSISPALIPTSLRWNDSELNFYENLISSIQNKYGNGMNSHLLLEKVKSMRRISIGSKAPEIKSFDQNGNLIILTEELKKITLVDFWASWCGPCRAEASTLVGLYNKYNSKGLQIVSVAVERSKERWKVAMEKDQKKWINISELKGYNSKSCKDYSITSIPQNFLLDSEGKIIAKNLQGKQLMKKIDELLK